MASGGLDTAPNWASPRSLIQRLASWQSTSPRCVERVGQQSQLVPPALGRPNGVVVALGDALAFGQGQDGTGDLVLQLVGHQVGRTSDTAITSSAMPPYSRSRRRGAAGRDARRACPVAGCRPAPRREADQARRPRTGTRSRSGAAGSRPRPANPDRWRRPGRARRRGCRHDARLALSAASTSRASSGFRNASAAVLLRRRSVRSVTAADRRGPEGQELVAQDAVQVSSRARPLVSLA